MYFYVPAKYARFAIFVYRYVKTKGSNKNVFFAQVKQTTAFYHRSIARAALCVYRIQNHDNAGANRAGKQFLLQIKFNYAKQKAAILISLFTFHDRQALVAWKFTSNFQVAVLVYTKQA